MQCLVGRLPTWVQHMGSISKHGASPIYTPPFQTEENTEALWFMDSFPQYLFLFGLVQIMSYRERHRWMLLRRLVSFVLVQIQALCNLLSLTAPCAAFTPRCGEVEERGEQNISRDGFATTLGPRANLKNFSFFQFFHPSFITHQSIFVHLLLGSKRAWFPSDAG